MHTATRVGSAGEEAEQRLASWVKLAAQVAPTNHAAMLAKSIYEDMDNKSGKVNLAPLRPAQADDFLSLFVCVNHNHVVPPASPQNW